MAKKKQKPDKNKRPLARLRLPNRRAMEGMLQQMVAGLRGQGHPDAPLDKAEEIISRAFDEPTQKQRVQLAKEALEICPDCADAYNLLAEHASNRKEACALYEQGMAAGARALGPQAFPRDVGHFWAILETRPYMRARLGLALSLWSAGRHEEAVRHLQEMLRLNPNDNQGVRYTLAAFLLFLDRDDDVARLLQEYDETSAAWAYNKALLAFRKHGDSPDARQLLTQAKKTNKHVLPYLTGETYPSSAPDYYSPGDDNEALDYIGGCLAAWKSTLGAVAWVRGSIAKKKEMAPQPRGPLGSIKKQLEKRLAQEFDVWQADFQQLPNWLRMGAEMVRPWAIFVTSRSNGLILGYQVSTERPSAAQLWDTLVQAMQRPTAGVPHRPTELQVRAEEPWESLKPHLAEIGIALGVTDDLDEIGAVLNGLTEHMGGQPRPGLLDMPGITPAQVGSFFEAAAFFFQHAPWKKVGDETAIKVECDKYESGPWYAVLMGQSGLTMGVALYEDIQTLKQLWVSDGTDEEHGRQGVVTSVTFDEEWTIPAADLEAAKKYGWPLARADAYPEIFHKERGLSVRPPLAWQLDLMEGCLRAIPEFVTRYRHQEMVQVENTVSVASGMLRLVLSWVGA
jgi:tetratricopeptide (TPR) repeat protein